MASDSSPTRINGGPSSPDDSYSTPISNTFSSPAASTSRRRRRQSTPTDFATPPPSSRFPATPTTNTRRKQRRTPISTPIVSIPLSTDDVPLSSEGGDPTDDVDEAPKLFVWRTNISVQDVNAAIQRFLRNFRDNNNDDLEGKYRRAIDHMIEVEGK